MNSNKAMRRTGRIGGLGALVALLAVTACDFDVTNPGPAQDEFLDQPSAASGVVAGARGFIDDVIERRDTRLKIIRALEMLENKTDSNPPKKHGSIPL